MVKVIRQDVEVTRLVVESRTEAAALEVAVSDLADRAAFSKRRRVEAVNFCAHMFRQQLEHDFHSFDVSGDELQLASEALKSAVSEPDPTPFGERPLERLDQARMDAKVLSSLLQHSGSE